MWCTVDVDGGSGCRYLGIWLILFVRYRMTIVWIEEFIVDGKIVEQAGIWKGAVLLRQVGFWMMGFCEYLRTRFNTSLNPLTCFRFLGLWPSDIVSIFSTFPCTYHFCPRHEYVNLASESV